MTPSLTLRSATLVTLLTTALSSHADTIYNTFGTAGEFDHINFWGIGGREDAVPFQVAQSSTFTSLSLALMAGGAYTVSLRSSDGSGLPGNALAQFSTSGTGGKETLGVGSSLSLAPGTYWISATSATPGGWYWNSIPQSSDFATRSGSPWTNVSGQVLPVLQVDVQPVPEPATLATLGLGAVGLLRKRRRKDRTP